MSRTHAPTVLALTLLLTTSACLGGSRQGEREADEAMEAEIASCRCEFHSETDAYDIPCGTTLCIGQSPVQCNLDGRVRQLESECDGESEDRLLRGICITDYPGEYPIACEEIASLYECESYGGCFVQEAPCADTSFGCEGFVTTISAE
jgi:hypothetical protein